ncbi:kinase-like domain-containing protein [Mycena galericulata]|nr:kinase-like domain-containing protein [Mycena galericulata]
MAKEYAPDDSDCHFPDLDPGFYDETSGRWKKPISENEEKVYEAISPHPRILKFYGLDVDHLELEYHPNGDLWTPPMARRVDWAVEIAEGLAYLHSKSIVWADAYFRNILVTDDLHIVLADFGYSILQPLESHSFKTRPPPIFCRPIVYYGRSPTHVDIFGFGVMLFSLLSNRCPWTDNLQPQLDEQLAAQKKHDELKFDSLDDPELKDIFGSILDKCFGVKYATGTELLNDLKQARELWRLQSGPSEVDAASRISVSF